jgi:eukaryotic-like serine/threonine-protein kinase
MPRFNPTSSSVPETVKLPSDDSTQATNAGASTYFAAEFPIRIGPYLASALLGRGGMGEVFLAQREDSEFSQPVALKVMPRWANPDDRPRFVQERQILARMKHPHIAALIDGGLTDAGAPYFAMELVHGTPLMAFVQGISGVNSNHAEAKPLPQIGRLNLFLKICDAVQYAHQQLVVHRDLKPGNILVEANGEPKLLDFGIAKIISGSNTEQTTAAAMTPAYAAPEQLLGLPVSTLTDVYALGVLFELLTDARPRQGASVFELVQMLDSAVPSPSRALALARQARAAKPPGNEPGNLYRLEPIAEDLDLIALTAMQREPNRRYGSAEAMAKDVRAYLAGRPVSARGDRWHYRLKMLVRRNPVASFAIGIAFSALIIAFATSIFLTRQARVQAENADAVKNFMLEIFTASNPNAIGASNISVRELLDVSAEQTKAANETWRGKPQALAEIQMGIAAAYVNLGEFKRAIALLDAAKTYANPSAALTRIRALSGLGELNAAKRLASDSLKLAQTPEQTMNFAFELAEIETQQGDYQIAEATLQAAMQSLVGDEQKLTLSLAKLYIATDRNAEAVTVLEASLQKLLAKKGPRHTQVANTQRLLATALEISSDRIRAGKLLADSTRTYIDLLGAAHPETLIARDELAFHQLRSGNIELAENALSKALADGLQEHGDQHYAVATIKSSLSTIKVMRGDYEGALKLTREVLATRSQIFKPNAILVLESRNILSTIYIRSNRLDEASKVMEKTIELIQTLPEGLRMRRLSSAESRIAEIYRKRGRISRALEVYERILAREDHPKSSFDLQPTLLNLTKCALETGNLSKARSAAAQSIALSTSTRAVPTHLWSSHFALGLVQQAEGNVSAAKVSLQTALAEAIKLGAESPPAVEVRVAMAQF